jgi:hypothetical protein
MKEKISTNILSSPELHDLISKEKKSRKKSINLEEFESLKVSALKNAE